MRNVRSSKSRMLQTQTPYRFRPLLVIQYRPPRGPMQTLPPLQGHSPSGASPVWHVPSLRVGRNRVPGVWIASRVCPVLQRRRESPGQRWKAGRQANGAGPLSASQNLGSSLPIKRANRLAYDCNLEKRDGGGAALDLNNISAKCCWDVWKDAAIPRVNPHLQPGKLVALPDHHGRDRPRQS